MYKQYYYEIPKSCVVSDYFDTLEECIESCKKDCELTGTDYNDPNVKLFMTDADGEWEITEEGELAG